MKRSTLTPASSRVTTNEKQIRRKFPEIYVPGRHVNNGSIHACAVQTVNLMSTHLQATKGQRWETLGKGKMEIILAAINVSQPLV